MKILNIDLNDYDRKFITIEVEPNETCKCEPYEYPDGLSYYPQEPSEVKDSDHGRTHEILIRRRHFSTGLTGQTIGYGDTWALGCGSGSAMGWTLGLDLETAKNAAKAYCNCIENNVLVASVYFNNVPENMEAYAKDKPLHTNLELSNEWREKKYGN